MKRILNKCAGIICVTKRMKDICINDYKINQAKILVSPDAVDLSVFDIAVSVDSAKEQLNLPKDKKILVYTGNFTTMGADKGISDILKAIKTLNDRQILFVAVGGSGRDIEFYKKETKGSGIDKQVLFLGHTFQKELAVYQKAADILLMPFPYTEHYAFYMSPLKMFEYMASKRPIIATDLPSVKEILNEDNAFLIFPDNPQRLAEEIKMVLTNPEQAQKRAQQAFQDVQNYTWEKRTEEILKFI